VTVVTHPKTNGNFVDLQREERITVRVSSAEKLKFEKMAKSRHTDVSEIIRQLLHREADSKPAKAGG
jgi:hypothetical protein